MNDRQALGEEFGNRCRNARRELIDMYPENWRDVLAPWLVLLARVIEATGVTILEASATMLIEMKNRGVLTRVDQWMIFAATWELYHQQEQA